MYQNVRLFYFTLQSEGFKRLISLRTDHTVPLCPNVPLSVFHSVFCLSNCLSSTQFLSSTLSLSVCLSVFHSVPLCFTVSLCLSLCPCVFPSILLFVPVDPYLFYSVILVWSLDPSLLSSHAPCLARDKVLNYLNLNSPAAAPLVRVASSLWMGKLSQVLPHEREGEV